MLALQRAAGNRAVVETLRRPTSLRVQRKVLDRTGGQQLDFDTVWAWLKQNPGTLGDALRNKEVLLKKAVRRLVDSNDDDYTLAQLSAMDWSDKAGLAFKGVAALDFSALKAKNDAAVEKWIQATAASGFDYALRPAGNVAENDLIATLAQQANPRQPARDAERRRKNLANLVTNAPKVTIRKGTWLMHMTKSDATSAWLKKGWVGGNSPDDYSFFTLYRRGPASAHANSFGALVIYSLSRDVHAFFIPSYKSIVRQDYLHAARDGEEVTNQPGTLNVGGDLAAAFLSHLPENKRPVAFVSPQEDELVFLNSQIPAVMGKEVLVTIDPEKAKREAQASGIGGTPTRGDARAVTNVTTRKVEKFYF